MTVVWRFWTGGEAPPYSAMIGAVIDGLSPDALRVDLTAADLTTGQASVLPWVDPNTNTHQARAHTANVLRWALLLEHGGVWLDHDVIPLVDVAAIPRPWCAVLGGEFVSCAIGLDQGDPLAGAMLAAGVKAGSLEPGTQAAMASGDGLLNGWAPPNRAADVRRLARHHLNPVPLPFDADGHPVEYLQWVEGRPPGWALIHLWHHREVAGKGNV